VGTLQLDGVRLAYWEEGSGQPVVFIHGVGTSGELWARDLAPFAEHCRLIVYDRRGYGASSESPRDWRGHRDDAIALIDALRASPAVVVGYSGGSIIASDLTLERPDMVTSLVLLDPAFNLRRCLNKAPAERRERLLQNSAAIFDDFASGGGEHVDESRLAGIDVPVTIIEAGLSPAFLRRSCERLKGLMPQARTVTLPNSGHHVGFDAADELITILREAKTTTTAGPE